MKKDEDYGNLVPGTKEYAQAVSARKEMIRCLSGRSHPMPPVRKTWAERMEMRTGKSFH